MTASLTALIDRFSDQSLEDRLAKLCDLYPTGVVFTTSFGLEDQVITHAISSQNLPIKIVTLDTGRLFSETYDVWARTEARYNQPIKAFYPNQVAIENLVLKNGINGFYDSVENRKACCHARKVEPLERALKGAKIWITGIRAEQSSGRSNLTFSENDERRQLVKVNPLLDWKREDLKAYVKRHDVPVNVLHARGFPSIGCQPCTRAISVGEDERAGRWWWENENSSAAQECGLHVGADGKLVRTRTVTEDNQNA